MGHDQVDPPWQNGASDERIWRSMEHLVIGTASAEVLGLEQELPMLSQTQGKGACVRTKRARKVDINKVGEVCMEQILHAMLR